MKGRFYVVLLVIVGVLQAGGYTFAADCVELRKKIRAEKDLKKRRALIPEVLAQCPEDPVLNYKYGLSLERFRKYEKAMSHYQKAILYDPKFGKAYIGMGDIYIYQGLLNEAIEAYSKGVELMPGDSRATSRLARLEIKNKALAGGVVTVSEFIKVMDQRGKISSSTPLIISGPALQYDVAFAPGDDNLLPTGIRQIAAVGQAMQNEALENVRFEVSTHVESPVSSLDALEKSKLRAHMIKDQLVTNFQIDPKRIDISWHGDTLPLELSRGMNLNERVEIKRILN